jgi:hypothetical protein
MAQFRVGKATVAQGQQTVVFTGASLEAGITIEAMNLFSIAGENVWYQIASVSVVSGSLTQVVLTTPYAGTTKTQVSFAIHRDFTTNLSLPTVDYGDINTAGLLSESISTLDTALAALGQITGPISGIMVPILTLRQGLSGAFAEAAGISIHREGLSPIELIYTGNQSWKRWTVGAEDIEAGRVAIGRQPVGSEKLSVAGDAKIDGNLLVAGDLTINGDSVVISASTLDVEDPIIMVGRGNAGSIANLGLKIERGASDAFFVWTEATDRFTARLSGDDLTNSTLGDIEAANFHGELIGNAATATKLKTARQLSVSGDATGQVSFDGSANSNIPLTLADTGVGAGTFTKLTVDAKGRAVSGAQLTSLDVTTALTFTPFGPADASSATVSNKIVKRDASGNFAANVIAATEMVATQFTGDLLGTAQASGRWFSSRTISLANDASGSVAIDGSANVTLSLTLAASGVTPGTYSNLVIDTKGRVTGARAINSADVTTGLGYTPVNKTGDTINGNLTITGNLAVQGTLTQVNTTTIEVDDPIMTVGKSNVGAEDYLGVKAELGLGVDAFFVWAKADGAFVAYTSADNLANRNQANIKAANFYGAFQGNASTATALQSSRTINGVAFNGTANISFGTDAVAEGISNKYYTDARARAAISSGSGIAYNPTTGVISLSTSAPVFSVAGRTGNIVLESADITDLAAILDAKASLSGAVFLGTISVRTNNTVGYAQIVAGNAAAPGAIELFTTDGQRRGLIGAKATGNAIVIKGDNGWGVEIQGATIFDTTPKVAANDIWHSGNLTIADYTPNARTLTAGWGVDAIGDLSANRTIQVKQTDLDARYGRLSGAIFTGAIEATIFKANGASAALTATVRDDLGKVVSLFGNSGAARVSYEGTGELLVVPTTGNMSFLGRTVWDSASLPTSVYAASIVNLADAAAARIKFDINATNTPFTPAGAIAATNVQAAIAELDTEKVPRTSSAGAALLPAGASADRPTGAAGQMRYNTETGKFEGFGSAWGNIGGGAFIGDNPPSNPGNGDLWWHASEGTLYVYYTDGDSGQWVEAVPGIDPDSFLSSGNNLNDLGSIDTALNNLGFGTFGKTMRTQTTATSARTALGLVRKPITVIKPTSAVAVADFSIPADCKTMRLSGAVLGSALNSTLSMRFSTDNGATYRSGMTDYYYSYISQSGTAIAGAGNVGNSALLIGHSSDTTALKTIPIDTTITLPTASQFGRSMSITSGYSSVSSSFVYVCYHGTIYFAVRPTHARLLMSSGNLDVDTEISVEYI